VDDHREDLGDGDEDPRHDACQTTQTQQGSARHPALHRPAIRVRLRPVDVYSSTYRPGSTRSIDRFTHLMGGRELTPPRYSVPAIRTLYDDAISIRESLAAVSVKILVEQGEARTAGKYRVG